MPARRYGRRGPRFIGRSPDLRRGRATRRPSGRASSRTGWRAPGWRRRSSRRCARRGCPAVLREITSCSAISLFDRPRTSSLQHLDLAAREAGGPLAPALARVAGGAQHRVGGVAVEERRPHARAQLGRRLVGGERGAMRPRLRHRVVRVGRRQHPPGRRQRVAGRAPRDIRSRRGARGAGPRSPRARASARDDASIRSVRYGCSRTRSSSAAVSGPGLSQIAFETPRRPRSCTSPARRTSVASASERPYSAPPRPRDPPPRASGRSSTATSGR